jgi:Rrf2 family protein
MKLSKKGEYALRALSCLVRHRDEGLVPIKEIAAEEQIPKKFLEQILLELRKAGLVESARGPAGGYRLVRDPAGISLARVIRMVDGPLAPLRCVSKTAPIRCPRERDCGLRAVMAEVREAVVGILEGKNLSDLAGGA